MLQPVLAADAFGKSWSRASWRNEAKDKRPKIVVVIHHGCRLVLPLLFLFYLSVLSALEIGIEQGTQTMSRHRKTRCKARAAAIRDERRRRRRVSRVQYQRRQRHKIPDHGRCYGDVKTRRGSRQRAQQQQQRAPAPAPNMISVHVPSILDGGHCCELGW